MGIRFGHWLEFVDCDGFHEVFLVVDGDGQVEDIWRKAGEVRPFGGAWMFYPADSGGKVYMDLDELEELTGFVRALDARSKARA